MDYKEYGILSIMIQQIPKNKYPVLVLKFVGERPTGIVNWIQGETNNFISLNCRDALL